MGLAVMPFESSRVVGVPLDAGHIGELTSLYADPRVIAGLGNVRPQDLAASQVEATQQQWQAHGFGVWAWFDKAEGGFLGRGGLQRGSVEGVDIVELTYCLVAPAWGRGLATELGHAALLWGHIYCNLEDIVAFVLPEHWRSRRVVQKLGMQYERDVNVQGAHQVLYRRPLLRG